jgi:hypothetical protein
MLNQKLLEGVLLAAGVGGIVATVRVIASRMPFKLAISTFTMGVLAGAATGYILHDVASETARNIAVAIVSIAAKEVVEFIVKVVGKLRDKGDTVADTIIANIPGKGKS